MPPVSETFELTPLTAVELRSLGELTIEPTEPGAMPMLTVEAAPLILPKLRKEIRDGRLVLAFNLKWWEWVTWWARWLTLPDKKIKYRLRATGLKEISLTGSGTISADARTTGELALKISGSGKIRLGMLEAGQLTVRVSGSGDLWLGGKVARQEISISGSGKVGAAQLESERTQIQISGSGTATVKATQELAVKISGSGRVFYVGEPQTITERVSGSGKIERLG